MGERRLRRIGVLVVLAVSSLGLPQLAAAGSSNTRASDVKVIARGLKNPRGLAFGSDHALYVAEAGKGGAGPCVPGFEGEACIGRSGAITRIWRGERERVVRGLPSYADPSGFAAGGPHDVAPAGAGRIYITMGVEGDLERRERFGFVGRALGRLLWVNDVGDKRRIADLLGFEARVNPDGNLVDSNPYGLLTEGSRHFVVDAGGNSLVRIGPEGRVRTVAVFRNRTVNFQGQQIPMESVPTTVVRGPDGALYVGELTGFPFPVGGARVYRVVSGQRPEIYRRGFTNIVDIAFGRDGSLYVLEIAHNSILAENPEGALIRVAPGGRREMVADGLIFPGGVALGSRGKLYVTNCGVCPGTGEVLRITP